jgi:hypothetical protein
MWTLFHGCKCFHGTPSLHAHHLQWSNRWPPGFRSSHTPCELTLWTTQGLEPLTSPAITVMLQVWQCMMASYLALQMVWALIDHSSFLFHPGNLHFRLIWYRPWPMLLLDEITLDAQRSFVWSSLANVVNVTLLLIQSCSGSYQLIKVSWHFPKFLHRLLLVLAISRRMCVTPHMGRGGRGGIATGAHSQPIVVSREGYDHSILSLIQQMLDDWEE